MYESYYHMAELSICAEIDTRLNILLDFFCKILLRFIICDKTNTSTPKCGDKDVQEKLTEILKSHMEDTLFTRDIGLEKS